MTYIYVTACFILEFSCVYPALHPFLLAWNENMRTCVDRHTADAVWSQNNDSIPDNFTGHITAKRD